jgi:hypothetical protein
VHCLAFATQKLNEIALLKTSHLISNLIHTVVQVQFSKQHKRIKRLNQSSVWRNPAVQARVAALTAARCINVKVPLSSTCRNTATIIKLAVITNNNHWLFSANR